MDALLGFFSALKSEIYWFISLFSSANTDTDEAQAVIPAPHDNPPTDHNVSASDTPVQIDQAAGSSADSVRTTHTKDEFPQLPPAQAADEQDYVLHHAVDIIGDGTDAPHGSGSVFAFDVPGVSGQPLHMAVPTSVSFAPSTFDAFSSVSHAAAADLSIHPSLLGAEAAEIISFKGTPSAGGGQSPSTGSAWMEYVTAAGVAATPSTSGLTFKLTFDQAVATVGQNFVDAVNAVAKQLAGQYDNHVTVSIDVGYNEVEGYKLGSALGESISNYATVTGGYAALLGANGGYGTLLNGVAANLGLPLNSDPLGTSKHMYAVTTAEGRALGVATTAPTYDGYIGINSKQDFNLADISNNTIASTQYDGVGTIAHEFTEVMGRQTWNGAKTSGTPTYSPLDLFHFSSSQANFGQHVYSGSAPGYFSLDEIWNPDTALATDTARLFNTKVGDNSDWAPGTTAANPPDAYDAAGGQGSLSPISHVDYLVMQAVGWHSSGSFTGVFG